MSVIDRIISNSDPTITSVRAKMSEGGKNDFYSNGDYWWPNPESEDGLPYIRRDGLSNPDNFTAHRYIMLEAVDSAEKLYLDKSERSIKKLNSILRTFFVDKETRMNPSLNYAQAIPGLCSGRSIGLIDTLHLVDIPFLIKKMKEEGIAEDDVYSGVSSWFSDYAFYLYESEFGKKEGSERNNHSIAYYVQLASFSLFSPLKKEMQDASATFFKERVIGKQMALDGSFPYELERTKPYSYSIFTFDITVTLAVILKDYGLPYYEDAYNRGIKKGLSFILPYIEDKNRWPYLKDVEHFEELPARSSFLYFLSLLFSDSHLMDLYNSLPQVGNIKSEVYRNNAVKLPSLYF